MLCGYFQQRRTIPGIFQIFRNSPLTPSNAEQCGKHVSVNEMIPPDSPQCSGTGIHRCLCNQPINFIGFVLFPAPCVSALIFSENCLAYPTRHTVFSFIGETISTSSAKRCLKSVPAQREAPTKRKCIFSNGGKGNSWPIAQIFCFKPFSLVQIKFEGMQHTAFFPVDSPKIAYRQPLQAVFFGKTAYTEQLVSDDEVFRLAVDFQKIYSPE